MYTSIKIVAIITEINALLLVVALTEPPIVLVSTIEPSLIGYLAITAFSAASLCSRFKTLVLNDIKVTNVFL